MCGPEIVNGIVSFLIARAMHEGVHKRKPITHFSRTTLSVHAHSWNPDVKSHPEFIRVHSRFQFSFPHYSVTKAQSAQSISRKRRDALRIRNPALSKHQSQGAFQRKRPIKRRGRPNDCSNARMHDIPRILDKSLVIRYVSFAEKHVK